VISEFVSLESNPEPAQGGDGRPLPVPGEYVAEIYCVAVNHMEAMRQSFDAR
jgi:hypothetical protein